MHAVDVLVREFPHHRIPVDCTVGVSFCFLYKYYHDV